MKVLVLILSIITIDGEFEITTEIVDECPDNVLFNAIMEDKRIHREILGWSAACVAFDKQKMMGRSAS
jgi:hypothetical protein